MKIKKKLSLISMFAVAGIVSTSILSNNNESNVIKKNIDDFKNNSIIDNHFEKVISSTNVKQPDTDIKTLSSQVAQTVYENINFDKFLKDFLISNCFTNLPQGFNESNIISITKNKFNNIDGTLSISSITVDKYIDDLGVVQNKEKVFNSAVITIPGFYKISPTTLEENVIDTDIVITDISNLSSNLELKNDIQNKLLKWVKSNYFLVLKNVPRDFSPSNIISVEEVISSENIDENTAQFRIKIDNYYANDEVGTQYRSDYVIGTTTFKFLLSAPENNSNDAIPYWVWIVIGVGIFVIIVIILVIILISKKKKSSLKKKVITNNAIKKPIPNANKLVGPQSPQKPGTPQNGPQSPQKPGIPQNGPQSPQKPGTPQNGPQSPQRPTIQKPTPPPPIKINNNSGSFAPKMIQK